MIISTSSISPDIRGFLLLDCWDTQSFSGKIYAHEFTNIFYNKLITESKKYNFSCVVNSSGENIIDYQDTSLLNTFNTYYYPFATGAAQHQEARRCAEIISNIIRDSRPEIYANQIGNITSQQIKQNLLSNNYSVFLLDRADFIYHWKKILMKSVTHWLVAGQSWGMCTHTRDLGLTQLSCLARDFDINFYATDWSFLKINGEVAKKSDFIEDQLNWELIDGFGYKLLPAEPITPPVGTQTNFEWCNRE